MVSKAGTNTYQGSVYDFHRNDVLDATNFFTLRDKLEKPPLIRNQYGFSLGGPIVPDTAFFFFNYEALKERKSTSQTRSLPNAATRLGMLPTGPGGALELVEDLDPRILPYFSLWPQPGPAQ